MNVNINVGSMLNSVAIATLVINNPLQTSRVFDVLNGVLRAITEVYESISDLTSWLDRF